MLAIVQHLAFRCALLLVVLAACRAPVARAQSSAAPLAGELTSGIPAAPPAVEAAAPTTESAFPLPSYLMSTRASNVAVEWNHAIQWVLSHSNATNLAPRLFALTHLAMWQALRANNATQTPARPVAVVGYAAMLTLKDLLPLYFDRYNALFQQQTFGYAKRELEAAYKVAGPVVESLLSERLVDGFQLPTLNAVTVGPPGKFQNTGIGSSQPVQQYSLTEPILLPANLSSLDFFEECPPPPTIPSSSYSIQYTSVAVYGSSVSTVRSLDQTNTAMFWTDGGAGTSSLMGQWNRLLLNTLPASLSLSTTAEFLAKYNVGLYDCTVAIYTLKYKFNFWRPVSALRSGDPSHSAQPFWTPLLANPNTPTYPSAAAAYAGFVETILTSFYGRDAVTFSVSTENRGPGGTLLPSRIYQSFAQAASEVVQSRYFGGIEFPVDSTTGRSLGDEVAQYVLDNFEALDL